MEGSREFSCYQTTSIIGRRNKNAEVLFLKVENGTLSGRGYVCNEEGKNGYVDDFSFKISEVSSARIDRYNGTPAFFFKARISNLYGAKKCQIALPQMKDSEAALDLINNLKNSSGGEEPAKVATPVAPAPPVPKVYEPEPYEPEPARTKSVAELRMEQAKPAAPAPEAPAPEAPKAAPTPITPQTPPSSASNSARMSADEFNKRMEKLTVLKDCGLLGENEFKAKKIALVSEFCDLTEFNEKIQKMIILKDCGVLSDKEFEANRNDIIKECCDFSTSDLDEFTQNIQKLTYLQMGDVITEDEYNEHRALLVQTMDVSVDDDIDEFTLKLKKMPVLRDNQVISDSDYKKAVSNLFKSLEISPDEPLEAWNAKLLKWPILAQAGYISRADLNAKQKELVDICLNVDWRNMDDLKGLVNKMVVLRDGEWLSQSEFYTRKNELIRKIDSITDYAKKLQARMVLPELGLISEADYQTWKQRCIAEIFAPSSDMSEFKTKANNLLELQNAGVITEKEFTDYKIKLMSDL